MNNTVAKLIQVRIEEMISDIYGEETAPGIYKLLESDIFNPDLTFGTLVETEITESGHLQFVRVVSESSAFIKRYILSRQPSPIEWVEISDINKLGGYCEVAMGGLFIVNYTDNRHLSRLSELLQKFDISAVEVINDDV